MDHPLLIVLALTAFVRLGSARHFEVLEEGTKKPCVLLDISFNIEITAFKDGKEVASTHLTPDDKGVTTKGACTEGVNEVSVSFGENSIWGIQFLESEDHPVAMIRVMQFAPKEIFGPTVDVEKVMGYTDERPVYLKDKSHSYKCDVQDEWEYKSFVNITSGYNFTVKVTVFDIHAQGMGLTEKKYGPAEICLVPVPGPTTTVAPAPIPLPGHYEVLKAGSDTPCVMLDVKFKIEVTASENGKQIASKTLTQDDEDIKANGTCSESNANIGILFTEKTVWSIFYEEQDDPPLAMYRVMQFVPKELFGTTVDVTEPVGFSDQRGIFLNNKKSSYKCDKTDEWGYEVYTPVGRYDFTVTVTVYNIQTQGYGLTERKYGEAEVCPDPGPVPPTLIPVPGPDAPVNIYSVTQDNVTCIVMETSLTLVIEYDVTTSDKKKTATVNVPKDARASGTCKGESGNQVLVITFLNGWELTFTFSKAKNSLESFPLKTPSKKVEEQFYRISNITLLLVVDKRIFPDHKIGEGAKVLEVPASQKPDFPHKSAGMEYYRCNSETKNVLKKGVEVRTQHLEFKAFSAESKPGFAGKGDVCSNDDHHKKGGSNAGLVAGLVITAIFVAGIAFFLVVMIARRRRLQYDNIQ